MLLIYMKDAFVFFIREKGEKIMGTVSEYFGSLVFDDRVMKATLSKEVYDSLKTSWISALPMRWRLR